MKILIISGGSIDEMWGRKWVADYEPDYCIAADSGLVMADKLGLTVDLLLGDYDSVDKKIFEKYNGNTKTITYPCEKDYTDTHLALKKAIEKIKKLQEKAVDFLLPNAGTGFRCWRWRCGPRGYVPPAWPSGRWFPR